MLRIVVDGKLFTILLGSIQIQTRMRRLSNFTKVLSPFIAPLHSRLVEFLYPRPHKRDLLVVHVHNLLRRVSRLILAGRDVRFVPVVSCRVDENERLFSCRLATGIFAKTVRCSPTPGILFAIENCQAWRGKVDAAQPMNRLHGWRVRATKGPLASGGAVVYCYRSREDTSDVFRYTGTRNKESPSFTLVR